MSKLISFAVPSYNSQAYLNKCIDSLLVGGDDVEIIIVNDGSKDNTAAIADEYAAKYPDIVKAVHKPNGGHGSGVNKGIELATGLFYKVVDSDDWVDATALKKIISVLKEHVAKGEQADLYITNFVYEHVEDDTQYVSRYTRYFPTDRFFGWNESKPLRLWNYVLMHSLMYSTELLRKSGMILPEHTFYVDNIYAYQPIIYTKKLYYLDVDFYRYYIGRSDQSVTVANMTKRYTQQLRVMRHMLLCHSYDEIESQPKRLKQQLYHQLNNIIVTTYFFTTQSDDPERRKGFADMWRELKEKDIKLYKKVRSFPLVRLLNGMSWKSKGRLTLSTYKFLTKHVKLGAY